MVCIDFFENTTLYLLHQAWGPITICQEWKGGYWTKKFEKHCSRTCWPQRPLTTCVISHHSINVQLASFCCHYESTTCDVGCQQKTRPCL